MSNPFRLEVLVEGGPFCDRHNELERLERCAASTQNVLLASPRRYGKTSLCRKVQNRLTDKGYLCFEFDFSGLDGVGELARRLARDMLKALHGRESLLARGKRWLNALTAFRPVLTFDPTGEPSVSVSRANEADDPRTLLEKTLEDLARIVQSETWPCHVVMDEFQDLVKLPEAGVVEGIVRKTIQGLPASFVFSGSRRSLLLAMFSDQKRFLTLSTVKMILPPLPLEETGECIRGLFGREGKKATPDVCIGLVRVARQYPFYVQRLASEVFEMSGDTVSMEDVERAKSLVLESETGLYETMISPLTSRQLRLLKALAASPTKALAGSGFVAQAGLPVSSITDIRDILFREDLIEKTPDGVWQVVDPFFSEWLGRL
ncbi:MAG: ATP-binding protein [Deltaproteobacteria bacterium]|nr:ATP-binding protein [Deltaproteobacteria bacterium]